jgi:spore germination protein GerM
MRTRVMAVVLVLMTLLVVACGVPHSTDFSSIDQQDIPERLTATSTTTTTTTTTTLPSTTTTVVDIGTTTTTMAAAETTTTALANLEPVALWYVAGRQVQRYVQQLTGDPSPQYVIEQLIKPPENSSLGLRTSLPRDALINTTADVRNVVTVDLPAGFFNGENFPDPSHDPQLAIQQIVLTLTELRGTSQVMFTLEGQRHVCRCPTARAPTRSGSSTGPTSLTHRSRPRPPRSRPRPRRCQGPDMPGRLPGQ